MNKFLISQIIVSLLLTTSILLQSKGSGLGSAWGGSSEHYRSKRGAEKLVFSSTIVLSILFLIMAILNALIS